MLLWLFLITICPFYFFLQFTSQEVIDPMSVSLPASVPPMHDLSTIDVDTFTSLSDELDQLDASNSDHTPRSAATPSTPTPVTPSANSASDAVEVPVGEEVIRTCVTPRKVQSVRDALDKEADRHRCAVRLLPYFFTRDELSSSNTDGTHGKQCLDSNKLNSLKVLVFSKFPVESATEKDRLWRFIKTKINARCRASKFAKREH